MNESADTHTHTQLVLIASLKQSSKRSSHNERTSIDSLQTRAWASLFGGMHAIYVIEMIELCTACLRVCQANLSNKLFCNFPVRSDSYILVDSCRALRCSIKSDFPRHISIWPISSGDLGLTLYAHRLVMSYRFCFVVDRMTRGFSMPGARSKRTRLNPF